jgi:hypothetical protein
MDASITIKHCKCFTIGFVSLQSSLGFVPWTILCKDCASKYVDMVIAFAQ